MLNKLKYSFLILISSMCLSAQPLFDSHLHYNAENTKDFKPEDILALLDKNQVTHATVIGKPSEHLNKLYQIAHQRIVPLLSLQCFNGDKFSWVKDKQTIEQLEKELDRGFWHGIGELHIFAGDRHSENFKQVIKLAFKNKLPLLIHGDPPVIDTLYQIEPNQIVIWAHAGTFPYPDLLDNYLKRYPNLSIDLSMRDARITQNGEIKDNWYELFVNYPDRFMIGVDTYSHSRWKSYDSAIKVIRRWIEQLPEEVSENIAFNNAARLYKNTVKINE